MGFNLELLKKAAIASISGFFLPVEHLLPGIAVLVVLDILTGMYVSRIVKQEDLTSHRFKGKIKQVAIFAIGLAAMLFADKNLQVFGITEHYGAKLFCAMYAFYELFSLLENLGNMGLPVAKELKDLLLAKKNKVLEKEKENDKPQ